MLVTYHLAATVSAGTARDYLAVYAPGQRRADLRAFAAPLDAASPVNTMVPVEVTCKDDGTHWLNRSDPGNRCLTPIKGDLGQHPRADLLCQAWGGLLVPEAGIADALLPALHRAIGPALLDIKPITDLDPDRPLLISLDLDPARARNGPSRRRPASHTWI